MSRPRPRPRHISLPPVTKEDTHMTALAPRPLRTLAVLFAATFATLFFFATSASASQRWRIDSLSDTTVKPGGTLDFEVEAANIGDADTDPGVTLRVTLPPDLTLADPEALLNEEIPCTALDGSPLLGGENDFKCETPEPVPDSANSNGANRLFLAFRATAAAVSGQILTSHFTVEGGGASAASTVDPLRVAEATPPFGIDAFDGLIASPGGAAYTKAAGHPYSLSTHLDLNTYTNPLPVRGHFFPVEAPRDIVVHLPPGLLGNPTAASRCTLADLAHGFQTEVTSLCPSGAQVGTVYVRFAGRGNLADNFGPLPLFNLDAPPGSAARFGFNIIGNTIVLDATLTVDHRIAVTGALISQVLPLVGTSVTFWGVPADPSHTHERACAGAIQPVAGGPTCASDFGSEPPFLRLPTACTAAGEGLGWDLHADSWDKTGALDPDGEPELTDPNWKSASFRTHDNPGYPASPLDPSTPWGPEVGTEGCGAVPFEPTISLQPTTDAADSPSGLDVDLTMPQSCWDEGETEATCQADLKDASVTQPLGMRLNPATAFGLQGCSEAQIGLLTTDGAEPSPIQFSLAEPNCPDASKIGSVEVESPLLDNTLIGAIYLARQNENPFGATLGLYAVASGEGVMIKLPAEVRSDPGTGQVTTIFRDNPQLPFSHFRLHLDGGSRAPLMTPPTCGTFTTHSSFSGWADPDQAAHPEDSFQITEGPNGTPCPPSAAQRPFAPGFEAGTVNPLAGAFSPFVLKLSREDGMQELTGLETTLPPGMIGRLAGIPYCPEAALAAASHNGGAAERANPSCPAASALGITDAAAGAGPLPFHNPGTAYLAGPYKNAPLSMAIITPAVAGPLDLGTVVVRAALYLDPETTQIRAVSDPLPRKIVVDNGGLLDGFPLALRQVTVQLDRPGFTLNPTSCDPMAVSGVVGGANGASADVSSRFQVGGCSRLAFKPKLSLRLAGKTRRTGFPALRATLKMPPGGANIARASVALPASEFLAQNHIRTICTRVQFAAGAGEGTQCPPGSVYGHAVAYSPLLDAPLQGPVYLRSSDNPLPDLVASLDGQIHVDLVGRIDSHNGGIRNTFELVPDAPVSKFTLTMQGGRKGLLENRRNICAGANRATVRFDAQNGKIADSRVPLRAKCTKKRRGARRLNLARNSSVREGP